MSFTFVWQHTFLKSGVWRFLFGLLGTENHPFTGYLRQRWGRMKISHCLFCGDETRLTILSISVLPLIVAFLSWGWPRFCWEGGRCLSTFMFPWELDEWSKNLKLRLLDRQVWFSVNDWPWRAKGPWSWITYSVFFTYFTGNFSIIVKVWKHFSCQSLKCAIIVM